MANTVKPLFKWRKAMINSDLPATTKHVLLTLSCHMNEFGTSCFPSIDTLNKETSLSRQSIITHLQKSSESKWLNIKKRGLGGQQWKRNDYSISWPQGVDAVKEVDVLPNIQVTDLSEGGQSYKLKAVKEIDSSSSKYRSVNQAKKHNVKSHIPEWLPSYLWDAFKEHREKLKKPLTEHAEELTIRNLLSFKEKGFNPVTLLEEAIVKGWPTVYEPKNAIITQTKTQYVDDLGN
ncbi:hypothetical protein EBAPG3_013260 [Nitrosospira lacus]|uniref:Helix-turn-helix domain-containing protein n=1 Tax=Nitrosospira lacus TaxID=1288494 RepID=A0A1W6SS62_9PROT|nr:helix-turn-helix domain-containing protein [Nitrosospira lacus]ARO88660.1 hypothetical protein EBAPG3_013260 [Nitrosospira lacus]